MRKRKKAFTMIEIVMILLIVSIIAAIAVPKFNTIQTNAKNSADIYTIRKIKAVIHLIYYRKQIAGEAGWPTGAEITDELPTLGMTSGFTAKKWCYVDSGDTVTFYCEHGSQADATGRRAWIFYRTASGSYLAGHLRETTSQH